MSNKSSSPNKIMDNTYDILLKLVIIGDSSVGKTNLLSRFTSNQFSLESKPTIGVQFASKTVQIQKRKIKVQIWDTAGQQRFRSITHAYYKGASGALIVFDLTRLNTYQHIPKWIKQLKDNTQQTITTVLIGNKCDLTDSRAVKQQQVMQYAQQNKMFYLQTSAMTSQNVQTAFMQVVKEIVQKQIDKQKAIHGYGITSNGNNNQALNLTKNTNNNNNSSSSQENKKIKLKSQKKKGQKKNCC